MDKPQGIEQLFASGMSKRQIARTLGITRKSVDRHLAAKSSKGATDQEAPTGAATAPSDDSKGAKAHTGSDANKNEEDETSKGAKSLRTISLTHNAPFRSAQRWLLFKRLLTPCNMIQFLRCFLSRRPPSL
jgi:hypothetical protein